MTYGNVYVASVAMGARDEHTLKAFLEAEAYRGPSLIIAYAHCIAHGIDMAQGLRSQKAAVESGQWLLYRFNPDRVAEGRNPLVLDSRPSKIRVEQYLNLEARFRTPTGSDPEVARERIARAQHDVDTRRELYEYLAARTPGGTPAAGPAVDTLSPGGDGHEHIP
jgi:pyruvate-ferredoxin/flavodoxin oxidoreductase